MQWTDEGIVIGVRRHGEANAILELMTREHGRHLGLVRGGYGSRLKPVLQPGNTRRAQSGGRGSTSISAITRSRPMRLRAASFFAASHAVYGVSHLAALMRLLPERDPHAGLYADIRDDARPSRRCQRWPAPLVVRFELQLLAELGFGLDLEQCAATGARDRSDLRLAEVGPGGVARGRRALGRQDAAAAGLPARCCGRAGRHAMSPTASRSPAFSSNATCWSRAGWRFPTSARISSPRCCAVRGLRRGRAIARRADRRVTARRSVEHLVRVRIAVDGSRRDRNARAVGQTAVAIDLALRSGSTARMACGTYRSNGPSR